MTTHTDAGLAADQILAGQLAEFRTRRTSSADERRARIQRVIDMLARCDELVEAIDADFGGRHPGYSTVNDVLGSLTALKYSRDHIDEWMQPEQRSVFSPYDQLGATAAVHYQPKGSVAIIGTWNAPVFTLMSPLAGVLAAGNRAVLKPSEVVPRTAQVLAEAAAEFLDPTDVAVVTGGPDVAQSLTSLPFDHIVFTGGVAAGRSVLENAARNLVPVTLELGGKSPTIIGRSADLDTAAFRIAVAKATNGGQLCVNPDTVYVPSEALESFLSAVARSYEELLPTAAGNPDVIAVVADRHAARVDEYVREAADLGARVVVVPDEPISTTERRRPLRLVLDPPESAAISQEEIFGPAMVVRTYDDLDQVLGRINAGPKPLALYYFGRDSEEQRAVIEGTTSGGVTINDAMMHAGMLDAPFGGVGGSGMGHYNGREGFLEFSHARTVFESPEHDPRREWGMLPPYGEGYRAAMTAQIAP
ncbi:aldehyde dehydrogenase family protein [Rhodococcus coprophilus]|uniref:Aldehyde dehydrogenase n=1 Tax=Rhodococcus coprophilus TaxID=38310 RepID=A0A2X4UJU7_9NOCA|nr:aldehyde dehydrogenase family protein [Rhodococcus coprophilus]MBM7459368.1 coniferyl-aldehyde dehydrogenase [Rhodococcus coprophilus]SQI35868.1 coniferyl aldehyde dehydrogenase [Rhodococcus coprophilus]